MLQADPQQTARGMGEPGEGASLNVFNKVICLQLIYIFTHTYIYTCTHTHAEEAFEFTYIIGNGEFMSTGRGTGIQTWAYARGKWLQLAEVARWSSAAFPQQSTLPRLRPAPGPGGEEDHTLWYKEEEDSCYLTLLVLVPPSPASLELAS